MNETLIDMTLRLGHATNDDHLIPGSRSPGDLSESRIMFCSLRICSSIKLLVEECYNMKKLLFTSTVAQFDLAMDYKDGKIKIEKKRKEISFQLCNNKIARIRCTLMVWENQPWIRLGF